MELETDQNEFAIERLMRSLEKEKEDNSHCVLLFNSNGIIYLNLERINKAILQDIQKAINHEIDKRLNK